MANRKVSFSILFIIFFSDFFFQSVSYADILMLDFNSNEKEVQSAQKAAQARGEKLIVLPIVDPNVKAEVSRLTKEENKFKAEITKWYAVNKNANNPEKNKQLNELYDQQEDIHRQLRKIKNKSKMKPEQLESALQDIEKKNIKLSAVVISGHNGNGVFHGEYGDIEATSFKDTFAKHPVLSKNIRSLLLLGCYSTNIGSILNYWKGALPNVEMIAGYENKAPLGDKGAGLDYLYDVLTKEKQLTQLKDEKALNTAFKKLAGVSLTHSSICVNDSYTSKTESMNITDVLKKCDPERIKSLDLQASCYLKGEPTCLEIPKDTANGALRKLYNELQSVAFCSEKYGRFGSRNRTPEAILKLIFYDQVKKNFANYYRKDMNDLESLMKSLGASDKELCFKNLENLSRAEMIECLNGFGRFLDNKCPKESSTMNFENPMRPECKVARDSLRELNYQLGAMSFVPVQWIEPNSTVEGDMSFRISEKLNSERKFYEGSRANNEIGKYIFNSFSAEQKDLLVQKYQSYLGAKFNRNYKDEDKLRKELDIAKDEVLKNTNIDSNRILNELKDQDYSNKEGLQFYRTELERKLTNPTSNEDFAESVYSYLYTITLKNQRPLKTNATSENGSGMNGSGMNGSGMTGGTLPVEAAPNTR